MTCRLVECSHAKDPEPCPYHPPFTVPTPRERVESACAQMLIELALLLPKGTDVRKHPIANKLAAWKVAMEDEWHLSRPAPQAPVMTGRERSQPMELLRAALAALLDRYVSLVNCGDCGNWDPEQEADVIAARAALASPGDPQAPEPPLLKTLQSLREYFGKNEGKIQTSGGAEYDRGLNDGLRTGREVIVAVLDKEIGRAASPRAAQQEREK